MIAKVKVFLHSRLQKVVAPALFIFLVTVLFILFSLLIDHFRISEIELRGVRSLNNLEIVNKRILFLLNIDNLKTELKEKNPNIETISIDKKYPDQLKVNVILVKPSIQLKVSDGWYLLSPKAKIIAKSRKPYNKVSTITYFTKYPFESYQVGDQIESQEIIYGAYFIDKLYGINIKTYDSIAIDHLFVLLLKGNGQEIWLTTKKNKEQQFDMLRTILRQFVVSGKKYKKIDLRFSKPIVTIKE